MTNAKDGLSERWERDFEAWRPKFDPFFEEQQATDLRILIWGPGERTDGYAKREAIISDLQAANEHNRVFTSEQLNRLEPRFEHMAFDDAEQIHADKADLIICLIVADRAATGVRAEVLVYGRQDHLQDKLRLLRPDNWKPQNFLSDRARKFEPGRCFDYTERQLEICHDIRAKCREWVEALRNKTHWHHYTSAITAPSV